MYILRFPFLFTLIAAFLLWSCAGQGTSPEETPTLTVMTHDSFSVSEPVIEAFESQYGVKVQFLTAGDAGTALSKAILSKNDPLADVLYGVDNTFLSRALDEGIFEPYSSPLLANISEEFKIDAGNNALPVDYGDVCLNYEIAYFEQTGINPPQSLDDLIKPEYRGMLVVQNPATSSPGLAFLLATIGYYGEEGYLGFWESLVNNNVLVVNDWSTAYNSEFSRYGGTRPIVVSYSSSPPFEIVFAEEPTEDLTTTAVVSDNTCFRQIEFVGILKGTDNRDLAEKWIDFMLSPTFQEDMPMQMFVFPVNPSAQLAEVFQKYMVNPQKTVLVTPQDIAEGREKWIKAWTETVLR